MLYNFWETKTGEMVIEINDESHCDLELREAYVTDMNNSYRTRKGRRFLLNSVYGWETVSFNIFNVDDMYYLGTIESLDLTLSDADKSVVSRCIEKEGFDFAMLHYSDYDGNVIHNKVESNEFHALRNNMILAKRRLETWLELNGVNVDA